MQAAAGQTNRTKENRVFQSKPEFTTEDGVGDNFTHELELWVTSKAMPNRMSLGNKTIHPEFNLIRADLCSRTQQLLAVK
jgi:hypothetical protein